MSETPNDFETRKEAFLVEYKTLIDKYQVDLMATPTWIPSSANGIWALINRIEVADTSNFPTPSPLQFNNGIL